VASTPARPLRSAAASAAAAHVADTPSASGLPVVCATPGGTGRRMRCVVGRTAPPAPTPGQPGMAPPQRIPAAGEVFFSANGSPLGAFVEDAGLPATPTGGVAEVDAAALGRQLEQLPESTLAGLQTFIGRILQMGSRKA